MLELFSWVLAFCRSLHSKSWHVPKLDWTALRSCVPWKVFNPNLNEVSCMEFIKRSHVLTPEAPCVPEPCPINLSLLKTDPVISFIDWVYKKYSELIYNEVLISFFHICSVFTVRFCDLWFQKGCVYHRLTKLCPQSHSKKYLIYGACLEFLLH